MKYNVTVAKLRPDSLNKAYDISLIEKLISEHETHRPVTCNMDSCEEKYISVFRVEEKGDYLVRFEFDTKNITRYAESLTFKGVTKNYYESIAEGIIKIILFLYCLIDFGLYLFNLYKARKAMKDLRLSFEQKFIFLLNIALIMYIDPVSIAHSFKPSAFT